LCVNNTPAHSVEAEAREVEWRFFIPALIILPIFAVLFELYKNMLVMLVLIAVLMLIARVVIHKMRVPLCNACFKQRSLFRRFTLSIAIALGLVSGYLIHDYALIWLPPGPDLTLQSWGLALFLGLMLAIVAWCFLRLIQLMVDPQSHLVTFNNKTKRFSFRNKHYQAAFEELNQGGYYEPLYQLQYQD
jgi:hypothetical protein